MAKIPFFLLALVVTAPRAEATGPETVAVRSGALDLRALLWRPAGHAPSPAVLFLHGSWPKDAQSERPAKDLIAQAATLGPVFARHGYTFLFLFRRGAGLSAGQGVHVGDLMQKELAANGQEARNQLQVRLLQTDELDDAVAGLAFLRALPEVDPRRVAIAGHSFGGALTLLLAERDKSLAAAVDFGGAAGSWDHSPALRARLLEAVAAMTVPVLIIHAENDYAVTPGKALAAELARLGKPHRLKIYPPLGKSSSDGHNLVDLGVATWERDVFAFLDEHLRMTHAPRR